MRLSLIRTFGYRHSPTKIFDHCGIKCFGVDFKGDAVWQYANGFREDAAENDPMGVMVRRNGHAVFPQPFLLDADRNIIESNGAP